MELELTVLALALLFSTANIFVYAWFENREKQLHTGMWVIRMTAVLPGFIAIVWAIFAMTTGKESTLVMALLTAGLLLVAGAIQLLSLLLNKGKTLPDNTN